jgi:hypothetical protein
MKSGGYVSELLQEEKDLTLLQPVNVRRNYTVIPIT